MPEKDTKYRIFISAAEPSADAHCAGLITALQQRGYDIEFVGVGGPKMAAAGCSLLEDTTGKAAMIYNAFKEVLHFIGLVMRIRRFFKNNKIHLVIVCDSPAFNFHVAKAAKKANIKTVFYVAPQLWAWARWRIRKLRKCCDKLCCILPFEKDWFGRRGLEAVFVGHPMLDELHIDLPGQRRNYADFNPANARIAIIPGSRNAEINSLWLPMQQIAILLKKKYPDITFTTVAVDTEKQHFLKEKQIPGFKCKYTIGSVNETTCSADFAIVASGSATLEVTAAGCPMVIMYQSSWILWHLVGWWLIKAKYLSLVNILAGKELVPEFMPYFTSIDPIVESIENLLDDSDSLTQLSGDLINLVKPLAEKKASDQVANIALKMMH